MNVDVDGRSVALSSLERVLWPATGGTKADLVGYATAMAPVLLPHLVDHPITLHRFPEGVEGPHFFQTRAPSHPPWVRAVRLVSPNDKSFEVVVLDDLASLVWSANLSTIELHPYLGTSAAFEHPTSVVFDLDPGPPAGLAACATVALELRAILDDLGLRAWVKVSGAKGMHLHVPIDGRVGFDATKLFAHAIAGLVAERLPELVVTTMAKAKRVGRVFVDWGQNDPWRSTIAPYSLRGLTYPTVAAPVTWEEVERVAATGDLRPLVLTIDDMAARLDDVGDLFADLPSARQAVPLVS